MMSKRDDLQWLRALAISAVVSFHLQPKIFPFGYLGVDIFFVISGYLMTSILSKSPDTVTFYLRRIKRIFPVYFLTITAFFVIGFFKLLPSHFDFLKSEVLWSIFFVNNFPPMLEKKEYFQMISEFKFLLHTWSLSVEIQFYLMAPFLIKFILSKNQSSLKWAFVIASFSCLLQTFIPNNAVAFGLVFCRIWQFLIGTVAFLYMEQDYAEYAVVDGYGIDYESYELMDSTFLLQEDDGLKLDEYVLQEEKMTNDADDLNTVSKIFQNTVEHNFVICAIFIFLLIICFNSFSFIPVYLDTHIFRLLATILTGMLIAINTSQPFKIPTFVNSIFVYTGDISYVIYLIHWPIIIFFKYFQITYGDTFTIVSIFAFSLLIHECFEKQIAKLSWNFHLTFIVVSYILIIFLLFAKNNSNSAKFDYIQENEKETESCTKFYYDSCVKSPVLKKYYTSFWPNVGIWDQSCSYKLNSTSNKTVFITGNSFVYFQIHGILNAVEKAKTKFSEAFIISRPGCNILVGTLNARYNNCNGYENSQNKILKIIKPDVIIFSARIDLFFPLDNSSNIDYMSDTYYDAVKRQVLYIANFTRRLIIIEPHPAFSSDNNLNPINIAHDIFLNKSRRLYSISSKEFHKRHDPSWNRVKEAVKYCKNCVIFPTERIMCPTNECPIVDPITRISLFCDGSHMTPRQSLKFIPGIVKAIDEDNPIFN